ncbi:MAG: MFS transporter [Christensenellales bacterium]|jgi:maltose/moltooligosaccharide transporter
MKLDNRRTALVGLAFLSICAFWQLYDFVIPLILQKTFLIGDGAAGWIMAADNILALFMLPLFGRFSDRLSTRIGRRMPFILAGTAAAVVIMAIMPHVNAAGAQLVERVLTGQADAALLDTELHRLLILFLLLLGLVLIAMGVYRSPAVALMPDVTPKPLRSRANAIINLMGALGGIITLVSVSLFSKTREVAILPELIKDGASTLEITNFTPLFYIVAAVMVVSVAILVCTVRENKLRLVQADAPEEDAGGKLPREMRNSLLLILFSVFFWFMGYNAVTTAYSKYFVHMWGDVSGAALCLTIATAGAVVSYIPVGMLSARYGRKRMIMLGVVLLAACFGATAFVRTFSPIVYGLFVLVGFAWASINVNSYPMVVEISKAGDVGKYTGYYYTFSMAGQIVTPILSGMLLERVGYHTLFPYAAAMVLVSFVTILFVRHGDSRPERARRLVDNFQSEDG